MTGVAKSFVRRHLKALVVIVSATICAATVQATRGEIPLIDGFLYDLSLALAPGKSPATEPVVLIALDQDSLDSQDLSSTPRVFLGPHFADVINAVFASGARVVGFDLAFNFAAEQFPAIERNYDLKFRDSLAEHRDKIVLVRSVRTPLAPSVATAIYDIDEDAGREESKAIAYSELFPEADGVVRRFRAKLGDRDGTNLPTFAATVLNRVGVAMPDEILVAPERSLEAIPTYSFVDVLRCSRAGPDALRAILADKIVIIGGSLPEEDRKRGPDRFMKLPVGDPPPRAGRGCSLPRKGASDAQSATLPGMYLHAGAVRGVITGHIAAPSSLAVRLGTTAAAGLAGAGLGLALTPLVAAIGVVLVALGLFALSTGLLAGGSWLPVALPIVAVAGVSILAAAARFLAEERRRRRVQRAFSHYLAPSVVDRLVEQEVEPQLGGEAREITIMFADLSGFTALSGKVGPAELMAVTNRYLAIITQAVEATGGYVDKFIGDAVMAMWGAPAGDPAHPASAARAALDALAAVIAAKAADEARGLTGYAVKIGLNSGEAVVGNVGSDKRYNYTAVGETVNIAARLESVPGDYGCRIVIGPKTAVAIAEHFILCELDWLKVKGKKDALSIFELVAERGRAPEGAEAFVSSYAEALELYRNGDFDAALAGFEPLAAKRPGGPGAVMAERCRALIASPPEAWDGIFVKTSK